MIGVGFCGSGIPVTFLAVGLDTDPLRFRRLNETPQNNSEPVFLCRETYVCFPVKRADDRGTHAGKKGPLHGVKPRRSEEEVVRLGEGAMGWYRKGKFQRFRFYPPRYLAAYPVPAPQDVQANENG